MNKVFSMSEVPSKENKTKVRGIYLTLEYAQQKVIRLIFLHH